eukprot:348561-Pelagomonas_calceolata.AAC.2
MDAAALLGRRPAASMMLEVSMPSSSRMRSICFLAAYKTYKEEVSGRQCLAYYQVHALYLLLGGLQRDGSQSPGLLINYSREPGEACTKNSVVRGANDPPGSASLICVHLPGKGGNSRLLPKPMRSFFLMMQGASSLPVYVFISLCLNVLAPLVQRGREGEKHIGGGLVLQHPVQKPLHNPKAHKLLDFSNPRQAAAAAAAAAAAILFL